MSPVVLDCSAAIALVLPEEHSATVSQWLTSLPDDVEIIVPALWWYESTNVLLTAVKRSRISAVEAREAMAALRAIPQRTDENPSPVTAMHLFHVGLGQSITAYDAAYLTLAELSGGTLLTVDETLATAARAMQIVVAPASGSNPSVRSSSRISDGSESTPATTRPSVTGRSG